MDRADNDAVVKITWLGLLLLRGEVQGFRNMQGRAATLSYHLHFLQIGEGERAYNTPPPS